MARPERPLDPGEGVVTRFAWQLPQLRKAAGNPSYRQMAPKVYVSATSLSEAAGGRTMPSLDAALGYVRACGGKEEEWTRRWQEAMTQTVTDADVPDPSPLDVKAPEADSTGHAHATPVASRAPEPEGIAPTVGTGQSWLMRNLRLVGIAAVLVPLGALAVAVSLRTATDIPPRRLTPAALKPAVVSDLTGTRNGTDDGADPRISGCAKDGTTLDQSDVIYPGTI